MMFHPMQLLLVALGAKRLPREVAINRGLVRKDGTPRTHEVTNVVANRFIAFCACVAVVVGVVILSR